MPGFLKNICQPNQQQYTHTHKPHIQTPSRYSSENNNNHGKNVNVKIWRLKIKSIINSKRVCGTRFEWTLYTPCIDLGCTAQYTISIESFKSTDPDDTKKFYNHITHVTHKSGEIILATQYTRGRIRYCIY